MSRNAYSPHGVDDLPLFAKPTIVQPSAAASLAARDRAIASLQRGSGESFIRAAADFILARLREAGPSTTEELTDACKAAGIVPLDDRAFGPVVMKLARAGEIEKTGEYSPRRKGHMSGAAPTWKAVKR